MDKTVHIIPREEARRIGMKRYFTGDPCIHGHIDERYVSIGGCAQCLREKTRLLRKDESYLEKERAAQRIKYHFDPRRRNRQLERHKERWRSDPSVRERSKEKCRRRAGDPRFQKYRREYHKKWYSDPENKMIVCMRNMVWRVLKDSKVDDRSEEVLGYTRLELVRHLERQFLPGMTWENYGEWHIDHIIPVSCLIRNGEDNPATVNALSNLRPMWASDNIRKGASVDLLL